MQPTRPLSSQTGGGRARAWDKNLSRTLVSIRDSHPGSGPPSRQVCRESVCEPALWAETLVWDHIGNGRKVVLSGGSRSPRSGGLSPGQVFDVLPPLADLREVGSANGDPNAHRRHRRHRQHPRGRLFQEHRPQTATSSRTSLCRLSQTTHTPQLIQWYRSHAPNLATMTITAGAHNHGTLRHR